MRRRKATVELFEEIRREYEFGVGTVQGVARTFGVHRRLVVTLRLILHQRFTAKVHQPFSPKVHHGTG